MEECVSSTLSLGEMYYYCVSSEETDSQATFVTILMTNIETQNLKKSKTKEIVKNQWLSGLQKELGK